MQLPQDFQEFIELALSESLKFVIVGGWAYNRFADPRATGDIDFFVERSAENERILRSVLSKFGFAETLPDTPLFDNDVIMLDCGLTDYFLGLFRREIDLESGYYVSRWMRCPIPTCAGLIEVTDDPNVDFLTCEDCATDWELRIELDDSIALVVKTYPYRGLCYVKGQNGNFEPSSEEKHPQNYDELVEEEMDE